LQKSKNDGCHVQDKFAQVQDLAAEMLAWDDFRYVKAIARGRSLAAAAEALGVNQSTVFRRLGQIESSLGSRLFERSRTGYALTPCGEEMVRLADRMEDDVLTFERQVSGHDLRPSGELRLTTNDTVLVHLLSDLLAAFRRAYPEISLDVVVSNQSLNLSKRDADVALRATDRPLETLFGRRLARIAWAVYGPTSVAVKDFDFTQATRTHNWIGFGDNLAGLKPAKWVKQRVDPQRIVYKINTVLGLAEAVSAGIGLALLPCFIAAVTPGIKRLYTPDGDLDSGLWLLTHVDLRHTARVRAFMDLAALEIGKRRKIIEGEN
jgi:DNA-binding transcriptional LysR family regulator